MDANINFRQIINLRDNTFIALEETCFIPTYLMELNGTYSVSNMPLSGLRVSLFLLPLVGKSNVLILL